MGAVLSIVPVINAMLILGASIAIYLGLTIIVMWKERRSVFYAIEHHLWQLGYRKLLKPIRLVSKLITPEDEKKKQIEYIQSWKDNLIAYNKLLQKELYLVDEKEILDEKQALSESWTTKETVSLEEIKKGPYPNWSWSLDSWAKVRWIVSSTGWLLDSRGTWSIAWKKDKRMTRPSANSAAVLIQVWKPLMGTESPLWLPCWYTKYAKSWALGQKADMLVNCQL